MELQMQDMEAEQREIEKMVKEREAKEKNEMKLYVSQYVDPDSKYLEELAGLDDEKINVAYH